MKNNIHFIFDFDGTLVDSFHAAIETFNFLSEEFNFRKIYDNEIDQLRDCTSQELIKYLKIPMYKLPSVLIKARALMRNEIKKLKSFVTLNETVKKLYKMNVNLSILTSNSLENVAAWLKWNDMENLFDCIHNESNFFGKKRVLKKIIKTYKMDRLRTFYIGDKTRDIEAARGCDIRSIAVTWGFNSEKILLEKNPHFIAKDPMDIFVIYEQIA